MEERLQMYLYDRTRDDILKAYREYPEGRACLGTYTFINSTPDMDISVIIPCYNVESYVCECLDSIAAQKGIEDISVEILAVNDGSQDGTLDILKSYRGRLKGLEILDQENMGMSGARNTAIRRSRGRYLCFVDSDDILSGNFLKKLYGSAVKHGSDIASSSYIAFRGKLIYKFRTAGRDCDPAFNGCPWGKLFRRELFDHLLFPEGFLFEDSILTHLIYPHVGRCSAVRTALYKYRSNPGGVMNSYRRGNGGLDSFYITDLMIRETERLYGTESLLSREGYDRMLSQLEINLNRISNAPENVKREVLGFQREFIDRYYQGYRTSDPRLKKVERLLKGKDGDEMKKRQEPWLE